MTLVDELRWRIDSLLCEVERLRELKTPASRQLLNIAKAAGEDAEAECLKLRAALEHTRGIIALFYSLEPLSDDGKKQLLELRDVVDKALANEGENERL